MLRGIYIAGSGMLAESVRQEVVANNLANALTTGYKRTDVATEPFGQFLLRNMAMPGQAEIGTTNMGNQISRLDVIAAQGPLRSTGNSLDLALVGDGWFAVDAPGGVRYTRDGSFSIDATGTLVTKEGWTVRGENGPIRVDRSTPVGIGQDGSVTQGGQLVGRLTITALDPASLAKEGDNLVNGTPGGQATARVRQGFLEGSTVNVVSEMVELIRVMRSFEANQKAVQAHDETLGQAITRVGVV
ncbi:MAG TPA: flagellar basal-body rod protein FlgF [Miltoncostaeaceae bacterium]|nr:flagellar basal-body rod protein FlgF [Miltoncostaeaceae bacterium]